MSADKKALAAARRLSQMFHGAKSEVVKLAAKERRAAPKYAMVLGRVQAIVYAPETGKRAAYNWNHESGDRGFGKPRSRNKPLLVVGPDKRPQLIMDRSPMKLTKRGLVG